jgi:hypothetical protein
MTWAAFGMGRPLLRAVGVARRDRLACNLWSVALGWIAMGLLLAVMGRAELLYAPFVGAITLLACLWGAAEWALARQRPLGPGAESAGQQAGYDALPPTGEAPPVWLRRGMLAMGLLVCLAALVSALAPPTAGSAIGGDLELSKTFLNEHALVYSPYQENSRLPLLAEMWYLWALALDGGVCAQLIHWEMAILLALAATVLATAVVSRVWAPIVGGLVLLAPGVVSALSVSLIDLSLAVLFTLTLAAGWQVLIRHQNNRWYVLSALAVLAAVGCCVRAAGHHGGPLFPLGETAPADSLGVIFLAAIPGLLLCRRLYGLGTLLTVTAGGALAWLALRPDGHFLLPLIPALATAAVWVGIEMARMPAAPRRASAVLLLGLVVVAATVAAARCRGQLGVALGLERRNDYLLRHEPTYEAAEVFNCLFDNRAHVLSQDPCGFYFNCRVTREDIYRRLTQYDGRITNPLWLNQHLRQAGFSHVLLAEKDAAPGTAADSPLARLAEAQRQIYPDAMVPLADYRFTGSDGTPRRYRLLMLR